MSGRTSGPWEVTVAHPRSKRIKARVWPHDDMVGWIADVGSVADATMMAAAPELRASIGNLVSLVSALGSPGDPVVVAALAEAAHAIAKADGVHLP